MKHPNSLIRFLEEELNLPQTAITLAERQCPQSPHLLPIALWGYGFVTLEQLAQIWDWLAIA